MKTTIYWTIQHCCRAVPELRFLAACWWLSQQVEFLEWRMRLEIMILPQHSTHTPTSAGQEGQYAVQQM